MNKQRQPFSKIILGIGILLLIYGFISRNAPINFFWESKTISWFLILIGLIGILINGINKRKENNKKTIWNKLGIGFISFIILIQLILMIIIPNSKAYSISKDYLKNNQELINEVGKIKGFGITPTGSISIKKDMNGETGEAVLNLIVKGEKNYRMIKVFSRKEYNSDWTVLGIK